MNTRLVSLTYKCRQKDRQIQKEDRERDQRGIGLVSHTY